MPLLVPSQLSPLINIIDQPVDKSKGLPSHTSKTRKNEAISAKYTIPGVTKELSLQSRVGNDCSDTQIGK